MSACQHTRVSTHTESAENGLGFIVRQCMDCGHEVSRKEINVELIVAEIVQEGVKRLQREIEFTEQMRLLMN